MTPPRLPDELVAVLRFEAAHVHVTEDVRAALVRQAFGLSLTRYRQRLARAVAAPGAEAVEPATVRRLRAAAERRTRRLSRRPRGA